MPTTLKREKKDAPVERRKPQPRAQEVDPDADTDEMEQISPDDLNERAEKERRKGGSGE